MRALITLALLAASATAQIQYYSAYLDGTQENPPTATTGHAFGVARFDVATSNVQLFCYHSGLTGPSVAAHLHLGAAGVNGGVMVGMTQTSPNTWTGSGTLTSPQAAALAAAGTYFNVHTGAFPGGEVRGQAVLSKTTRFTGVFSGAQEVPANASTASGTVTAWLHEPDNRLVYVVQSSGLTSVSAAHFHQAASGVSGPVIVTLNGASGTYGGVSPRLTSAQMTALLSDGLYGNIHTTSFPGGEIRAQLRRDVGDHFQAVIRGSNEVPPNPSLSVGGAQLILNPNGTVTVTGGYQALSSGAVASHVHRGAAGVNGPVVFPLTFAGGVLSGTFTPSATDLADLRAGNWYVNVHSVAFGGGELRGQLVPATLPSVYGEGCLSTSGNIPHMGATGFASMGSSMGLDCYGLPLGSLNLFLLSDQRDPGPIQLPAVGIAAPTCFALIPTILLQFTAFPNANGVASQPLSIPVDPALRNIPLNVQNLTFDLAANAAGLVTSNALTFFIH